MSTEAQTKPEWLQGDAEVAHGADEDFSSAALGGSSSSSSQSLPPLQRAQSVAVVASLVLAPVAVILVSVWASVSGGMSWKQGESKLVFNWHPVLMVTSYALMTAGALLFRVSRTSSYDASVNSSTGGASPRTAEAVDSKKRGIVKASHAALWTLIFILGIVAMLAVFKSHNDPISGYIANLYSFHSWVGVLVLTLFFLQFLVGIMAFGGLNSGRSRIRSPLMMEIHKYTGTIVHFLVTATIMTGIQEKEGFGEGCNYEVDSADLVPIMNIGKIPQSCVISHSLGLIILAMGLCTSFALHRFPVL